jgi:hypothetical protein
VLIPRIPLVQARGILWSKQTKAPLKMMKTKTKQTKPQATISALFQKAVETPPQTPLEAILSFRNWTGLNTRELWHAGRLGNHPGEYLMSITSELFPVLKVADIKKRNALVAKAIEELNK